MSHHVFLAQSHQRFVVTLDAARDSYEHVVTEHLRASGVYWGLAALEIMSCGDALSKADIIRFVLSCHHPGGGFGGNVGHDPHLLYTLSCLQLLAMCDGLSRLPDKEATVKYISSLQQADGSFAGDEWLEIDTRFSYCALQALAILGRLDAVDVKQAVSFIASCRNFDGGFGAVPGAESHAGQVFCCVGALAIAGALHEVDADLLGWWLAERQVDSGGLNGRPEKQSDVCYSWWILSALSILGRVHWIDTGKLASFILDCQDADGAGSATPGQGGGIADRPGNQPDVFHTFFGIAGLSLLGCLDGGKAVTIEGDDKPAEKGQSDAVPAAGGGGGDGSSSPSRLPFTHQPIDPVYALPAALVERMGLPRHVLTPAPFGQHAASLEAGSA